MLRGPSRASPLHPVPRACAGPGSGLAVTPPGPSTGLRQGQEADSPPFSGKPCDLRCGGTCLSRHSCWKQAEGLRTCRRRARGSPRSGLRLEGLCPAQRATLPGRAEAGEGAAMLGAAGDTRGITKQAGPTARQRAGRRVLAAGPARAAWRRVSAGAEWPAWPKGRVEHSVPPPCAQGVPHRTRFQSRGQAGPSPCRASELATRAEGGLQGPWAERGHTGQLFQGRYGHSGQTGRGRGRGALRAQDR